MKEGLAVTGWARWEEEPGAGSTLPGGRREEPAVEAAALLALRCLERARLRPGPRLGLILAVGTALAEINREHARCVAAARPVSVRRFLFTTANAVSARVAILAGIEGECLTVADAVAPFWIGGDLLLRGAAEAVLVGGTSVAEGPGGARGGAALLCLERSATARGRGAPVAGALRLEGPGPGTPLGPGAEEAAAASAIAALEAGGAVVLDGGRRGRLILEVTEQRERRHR
jgi:hypothetical protein